MNAQLILAKLKQYPLAVAGTVLSLIFLGLLFFTSGTANELEGRYIEVEDELKAYQQNEINAVGLTEDLKKINKIVENIDGRLMHEDAKADHYQYFLGIAERSGVAIDDPSYGGYHNPDAKGVVIETKEYAVIEYSLTIDGTFQQILDFLYDLRTGNYFVTESRMSLYLGRQSTDKIVTADLAIRVLAFKKEVKKDG